MAVSVIPDSSLLQAARQGDPGAFEQLVAPCEQKIWRICWMHMRQTEDAQDCMQEAMLKAWRSLPQYRGDASLETWLCRVAANTCLDLLRKKKSRPQESLDTLREAGFDPGDPQPALDDQVIEKMGKERLSQALDALPPDLASPLILYALEDRSYEETASLLSLPVGTVKSRIARARERLRKILSDPEPSDSASVSSHERRVRK